VKQGLLLTLHASSRTSPACSEQMITAVLLIANQCMYLAQRRRQKSRRHAH